MLDFVLVNNSALQLSLSPQWFRRVQADMHALPLSDASCDGAMFCYALCHANTSKALAEAARVTRPGGFLFVYDYDRVRGDNHLFETRLCARALAREEITEIAQVAGWVPQWWINPEADDTMFRTGYANNKEYYQIFNDIQVCMWRMVRV